MKILYQTDLISEPIGDESASDPDSASDTDSVTPSDGSLSPRAPDAPKSCLKPINSVEKAIKRPISCLVKEERFNHIQRHLHPLAYICD